jgi:hypothetical protein
MWIGSPSQAVTLGLANDFEDETTQGWRHGRVTGLVTASADGGPDGAGDAHLQVAASGGFGPGSKLVAFTDASDLTGDYLSIGATGISLFLRNPSDEALTIRLQFEGAGGAFVSLDAVSLASFQGWTQVSFGIGASDLTGGPDYGLTMGAVSRLRIMHNPLAIDARFSPAIAASLGIDDIHVVPEPSVAGLLALGLVALGVRAHRSRAMR